MECHCVFWGGGHPVLCVENSTNAWTSAVYNAQFETVHACACTRCFSILSDIMALSAHAIFAALLISTFVHHTSFPRTLPEAD